MDNKNVTNHGDENNYGIVYALTNPAMPGLVKIGMTTNPVEMRKKQLYLGCTGVPLPFECAYACKVNDYRKVEKNLHIAFAPDRINPNREFFKVDIERVIAILELFGPNEAAEVNKELDEDISKEEKDSVERMKKKAAFNFEKMGIPIGAKLTFIRDSSIEVEVAEGNKVKYGDEIMSLTALTQQLTQTSVTRPTFYWTYEGTKLSDLWEDSLG